MWLLSVLSSRKHVDRKIRNCALVGRARVGVSESQQMPPGRLDRPHVQCLGPLEQARTPILLFEKRSGILLRKEHHLPQPLNSPGRRVHQAAWRKTEIAEIRRGP